MALRTSSLSQLALSLLLGAVLSQPAAGELPAKAFFQPFLTHVALSPDGTRLAALVARGEKETIIVRGTKDAKLQPVARNEEPGWRISELRWANDERLIFEREAFARGLRRQLFAVNYDGSQKVGLGDFVAQPDAGVIGLLRNQRDRVLAVHSGKAFELDILHGHMSAAVAEQAGVEAWFADASGQVRAGASGWSFTRQRKLVARAAPEGEFSLLSAFDPATEPGLDFGAFGEAPSSLLVFASDPASRTRLRRYDLAAARLGEEVFSHPEVDVGEVVLDYRGRAVGIDYIVDLPRRHYWDETAAAEQRGLDRVFGDTVNRVVGSSWDGQAKLVLTSGPTSPPQYYLFEREQQQLSPLFSVYPELEGATLAETRAIRFAARDGLELYAYVTTPPTEVAHPWPTIVLVHDNSAQQPRRDWLRFDPLVQFLADRGFAILQVNYRGSGGYGAAFEAAGRDEWGLGIQADLEDGVLRLIADGVAEKGRVGIFGHGFGGYSSLAAVVRNPGFYAAAAAYGAPTDLATLVRDGQNDWGDPPDASGQPSGAWADRERVSASSPYDQLEAIDVPILLGHGALDARVHIKHAARFHRELEIAEKPGFLFRFEDEHSRLTRDDHRALFYQQVADFFREHLSKPQAAPEPG